MGDWKNKLFFGDNLSVLRAHIPDDSVDLIYLDPPFNSKANYNVLFEEKDGEQSSSQITAFEDNWHWSLEAESIYKELVVEGDELSTLMEGLRTFLGQNDLMAYLVMMAVRLKELKRVLKDSGSVFLHCDTTASHYIKLVMDAIFSAKHFQNEIAWIYRQGGRSNVKFAKKHDTIFWYSKTKDYQFYTEEIRIPYEGTGGYVSRGYNIVNGKKYEVNPKGKIPEDWWDIPALNPMSKERLGYPTQKPEELLERIIKCASKEGDIVLDPFCGCGTAVNVSERLNRKWIGIDITHLAIKLIKNRLHDSFGKNLSPFNVLGEPTDYEGAKALAQTDRYQFEWWADSLIGARPYKDKKKGADGGIDGVIKFFDDDSSTPKTIIVQVKSGHVKRNDISTLKSDLEREKGVIGIFLTLEPPTKPMKEEAAQAGFYEPEFFDKVPKIQILTIEGVLNGTERPQYQEFHSTTYKKAQRHMPEYKTDELF